MSYYKTDASGQQVAFSGLAAYGVYGLSGAGDPTPGSDMDYLKAFPAFKPIMDLNVMLVNTLAPLYPIIDKLKVPAEIKDGLKNHPIETALLIVKPVEDILKDIIRRANKISGLDYRDVMIPKTMSKVRLNMDWEWPEDSSIQSTELKNFVQRLRIFTNMCILFVQTPGHLSVASGQVLLEKGISTAQDVFKNLLQPGQQAVQQSVQRGVDAAKQGADQLRQQIEDVARNLPAPPFNPFGGLGASGIDDYAGAAYTYCMHILSEVSLPTVLGLAGSIGVALIGLAGTVVGAVSGNMSKAQSGQIMQQTSADQNKTKIELARITAMQAGQKVPSGDTSLLGDPAGLLAAGKSGISPLMVAVPVLALVGVGAYLYMKKKK